MLQNAYFLAKIGADTAENEQHLPKFCQKLATTLRAVIRRGAAAAAEAKAKGEVRGGRGLVNPRGR